MSPIAPERIHLDARVLTVLERVFAAAAPEEGCALLLGDRRDALWSLRGVWPCCNVWDPAAERLRRFSLDPREQLLAQKWARRHRLELLGAAHSHPQGPAVPSATDRRLTPLPSLMLIAGREGLACWWLADPALEPRRLPWQLLAPESSSPWPPPAA